MDSVERSGGPALKPRRDGLLTNRRARQAVVSKLRERGYEVPSFATDTGRIGAFPVVSPARRLTFLLEVRGLYRLNPWIIKTRAERDDLFYVLALVPDDGPTRLFVLTQAQVYAFRREELERHKRPADYHAPGVLLRQVKAYEDAWDVLPS
ncbi:hypothetical protein [Roseomonas populi]|uniref:Endonuclease n=1 Tax=Roseomonas populi TaxID=3121582 RepID=A0ABT1WXK8_9PROT|nr:hypothetical protein [Roseomonas pecuniae]MCR0980577.1 hypothetical protein [Roseomonas pecuniae]